LAAGTLAVWFFVRTRGLMGQLANFGFNSGDILVPGIGN